MNYKSYKKTEDIPPSLALVELFELDAENNEIKTSYYKDRSRNAKHAMQKVLNRLAEMDLEQLGRVINFMESCFVERKGEIADDEL